MAEFTDFLENELLDHVFANAAYTAPATVYLALYTTNCTDAARGTEVTGAGYARKPITFGTASAGTIANSALVSFAPTGGNYGTVVCTGIESAVSGGNQLCFDTDFVDTAVNDGDTLQFAIGAITVSLT